MQWIILIGDENFTLDSIKAIEHYGTNRCYNIPEVGERYCVDYGKDHVFYDHSDSIIGDYEQEELKQIPFANPHFILMIYQSEDRMRKILQQDNFLRGIYIDDDYGHIMPIEEFIRLGMPMGTS